MLCRLALAQPHIDPASFTALRLLSGATCLWLLVLLTQGSAANKVQGNWRSAGALFVYAAGFSFAYQWLDTATGALILFASVQITMLLLSKLRGQDISYLEWLGVGVAFCGLIYLLMPGVSAPPPLGAVLMAMAGIAWGLYTLWGANSHSPLSDTGGNFLRSIPFLLLLLPATWVDMSISLQGSIYALLSGALASGVGYAIWYRALRNLNTSVAAVSQLSVPIIAAIGGVIFVAEPLEIRVVVSATVILGGILLVIASKRARQT